MESFDQLPKSIKKVIRYINQDITSIGKLENLEQLINKHIDKKKEQLRKD